MAVKFQKSKQFALVTAEIEEEILEQFSEFLESSDQPDLLLIHIPELLARLKIPNCYYKDITECTQWFYDTQKGKLSHKSAQWGVVTLLLQALTLSVTSNGVIDVSDIIDVDKLVQFCNRLIKFRNAHQQIVDSLSLFTQAAGYNTNDVTGLHLSLKHLQTIKVKLQLDDLSDSILIDMLGCSGTTVDGTLYNYRLSKLDLLVGIKDFAEVMGQLGELD